MPAEQDLRRRVKRELRKRARGIRRATPLEACAARSARIVEGILSLEPVRTARAVSLFWPIEAEHEPDLRPLDAALRARGVRVAYPALERAASSEDKTGQMTFHFVGDVAELAERGGGFAEPREGAPALSRDLRELDVVVVPALALDPAGQRIGFGAGYYDRALATVAIIKVGVIFDFELLSEVPTTDGDVAVDWVVTDARVLRAVRSEELCAPSTAGAGPESPCRS
jgi:5-formyltetrahydrofolate cyclo-ligase